MNKTKETGNKQPSLPPMPFDDALRKILSAPPQHKTAKKKMKKK